MDPCQLRGVHLIWGFALASYFDAPNDLEKLKERMYNNIYAKDRSLFNGGIVYWI